MGGINIDQRAYRLQQAFAKTTSRTQIVYTKRNLTENLWVPKFTHAYIYNLSFSL